MECGHLHCLMFGTNDWSFPEIVLALSRFISVSERTHCISLPRLRGFCQSPLSLSSLMRKLSQSSLRTGKPIRTIKHSLMEFNHSPPVLSLLFPLGRLDPKYIRSPIGHFLRLTS